MWRSVEDGPILPFPSPEQPEGCWQCLPLQRDTGFLAGAALGYPTDSSYTDGPNTELAAFNPRCFYKLVQCRRLSWTFLTSYGPGNTCRVPLKLAGVRAPFYTMGNYCHWRALLCRIRPMVQLVQSSALGHSCFIKLQGVLQEVVRARLPQVKILLDPIKRVYLSSKILNSLLNRMSSLSKDGF